MTRHSSDKVEADIRRQMEKASSSDFGPLFTPEQDKLVVRLHHDVPTSQREERRQQQKVKGYARHVLMYLRAHGLATRNELEQGTGIRINLICSAVAACIERGWILDYDGKAPHRPHRTRDGGRLLELTPLGLSVLKRLEEAA